MLAHDIRSGEFEHVERFRPFITMEGAALARSLSRNLNNLSKQSTSESYSVNGDTKSSPLALSTESLGSKKVSFPSEMTAIIPESARTAESCLEHGDTKSSPFIVSIESLETRKVSFPSQMTAVIPESTTPTACVDSAMNWYLQDELTMFRAQARDMCRHMRNFTHISLCTLSWDNNENKCDTRGLEQRSCLERQRRKFITNKFILKASQELSADRLADLASKVTAWAVELAAQEAVRDFYRAYGLQDENPGLKRQISSEDESSRNVKQRSG